MMRVVEEIAAAKRKTGNFQGLGKSRQRGTKVAKHFKRPVAD